MEYKYPHLFSPIKVGRLTLKNRIEAAPVNISNLPISGYPTAENIAIFEGKAKGGAAIVHMGECRIDMKTGISHKLCIALDDPEVLPYLHAATDAIKKHNAFAARRLATLKPRQQAIATVLVKEGLNPADRGKCVLAELVKRAPAGV